MTKIGKMGIYKKYKNQKNTFFKIKYNYTIN